MRPLEAFPALLSPSPHPETIITSHHLVLIEQRQYETRDRMRRHEKELVYTCHPPPPLLLYHLFNPAINIRTVHFSHSLKQSHDHFSSRSPARSYKEDPFLMNRLRVTRKRSTKIKIIFQNEKATNSIFRRIISEHSS